MVGHVDFKFVLNSNITNIPQIQVTLLKNKAPGLGKVNGKKELEESFTVFFSLKVSVLSEVCWKTWLKLCKYFHFLLISFLFCFSGSCSLFSLNMLEGKLGKQQFWNPDFVQIESAWFRKVEPNSYSVLLEPCSH